MGAVITLANVVKEFDGSRAVDNLSFDVPEGSIFGLLGPSGSGKTSAIRLMIGVYAPSAGSVEVFGFPPPNWPDRIRESVGYMPQMSFLYPNLSVAENLNFAASVYGLGWFSRRHRLRQLLEVVQLWQHRRKLASQLSGGMQKRLSLACALVQNPALVFLDEPTAGIDPILRQHFWEFFRQLRDEHRTLLVTSHYVGEAEYCDQVAVIDSGHLIAVGTPVELRRQALGGDAVDIDTPSAMDAMRALRDQPGVRAVHGMSLKALRVFVEDAGKAVPRLAEILSDQGLRIDAIREYHPSFDEVFGRLVEHPNEGGQEQGSEGSQPQSHDSNQQAAEG